MADKGLSKQEKQRLKEKEKFERERQQWKKQEARKRVKKTGKKDRGPVLFKTLAIVLVAAIALGLVSIFARAYGVPGQFMPALTVGAQNVKAPVWAFNFYNLYRNMYDYGMIYGMDTSKTLFGQAMKDAEGKVTGTWDEYFRKQVNQSLQNEIALYSEAKKAGFQLGKKDLDELDETMKQLKVTAAAYSMSVNSYLRSNYVPGITGKTFRALEERRLVVQGFSEQKSEEFRANHPASELREEYDKDPTLYNLVDYRIYQFAKEKLVADEGESTSDLVKRQLAADDAVIEQARGFISDGGTQEGFIAGAQALYDAQHQHEEGEEVDDYDADAATLNLRQKKADISGTYGDEKFAAWFFDAARKAGDTTTWETDSAVYAAYLARPSYAQTTVDFYTINVAFPEHEHEEGEEHSDDELTPQEQAKQNADNLLAKWQENGGTKEAFVALVKEQATAAELEEGTPGLNEKAVPGGSGIAALDSWLFDAARKPGEATVIEASDSYKVVYLSSQNADSFVWQGEIADKFVEEDYTEYVTGLQEQYKLGYHGIGIRYAVKDAQKMCDAFMEYAAASQQGYY